MYLSLKWATAFRKVLATAGNNSLGGDDFDKKLWIGLLTNSKKSNGIDLSSDKMAMQRVKGSC